MDVMDTRCNFSGLRFDRKYSQWMNNAVFFDYYCRMKEMCINEFEWINLPDTCDARFLELILFEFGHALFFQHDLNGAFLTLQCTLDGQWNMYRIPIVRHAYAVTGFTQTCSDLDSVVIFNNYLRQPTSLTVELLAQKMTLVDRSITVNINAQKTPVLIKGSVEQQRGLKSVYDKYEGNEPVIFGDKDFNMDTLKVLNTNAPESYLNLMTAKARYWNEFLTFIGINNTNNDKRERMITDEVNANGQEIDLSRYMRLNARKDACKLINALFANRLDKPIDVRFRGMGGEDNVSLYDGTQNGMRSGNSPDR